MRPGELVERWVAAFNRADSDALARFYAPDAVNHQVAEQPVQGREAIRRMFSEGFARAKMVCLAENLFEEGDWAILEWRDPLGLRGCGFFRVVNGEIAFQRGYWDRLSFIRAQGMALEVEIRPERSADASAIRAVHAAAFPSAAEADLVDALRAAGAGAVSQVAVAAEAIVGHVLLSPVSIPGVLGLAPIAVFPGAQRAGVGTALMRGALARARTQGAAAIVLVGEPAYYRRFGFVPARAFGLRCKWAGTEEAFMALELVPGALEGRRGLVSYHPAFDAL